MAIKYHCPKCGKKFVEWGAEKVGFRCPDCEDEELVRVGGAEDAPTRKRPTLRRIPKKTVVVPDLDLEDEEQDEVVDDDVVADADDEIVEPGAEGAEEAVVVDADVDADVDLTDDLDIDDDEESIEEEGIEDGGDEKGWDA